LLLSAVLRPRAAAPLLLGARNPPLSIDIFCPHGVLQQTRRIPLLLSIDKRDGRTDGRTLDRYIEPAAHTMQTVPTIVSTHYKRMTDRSTDV